MQRIHRTAIARSDPLANRLEGLIVPVKVTTTMVVFEVEEADALWPRVRELLRSGNAPDSVRTAFTMAELRAAEWLELTPTWHWSYPMPDDDAMTFRTNTYDLRAWCRRCFIGAVQVKPFLLKSEPKWGTRHFLKLNWVFDEYFVRPEVWQVMQADGLRGITVTVPLHHKTGKPLETVLQLRVNHVLDECLVAEDRTFTTCGVAPVPPALAAVPGCGRPLYDVSDAGPLKLRRGAMPSAVDMVKTAEWFGGPARRKVLVSSKLGKMILGRKWRGVELRPVQLV